MSYHQPLANLRKPLAYQTIRVWRKPSEFDVTIGHKRHIALYSPIYLLTILIDCLFSIAICDGKTNQSGACQTSQYVPTKKGLTWANSEGSCVYPENCFCKSVYFYNDGPRCTGNIRKS